MLLKQLCCYAPRPRYASLPSEALGCKLIDFDDAFIWYLLVKSGINNNNKLKGRVMIILVLLAIIWAASSLIYSSAITAFHLQVASRFSRDAAEAEYMNMVLMLIAYGMDTWASELQAKDVKKATDRAIAMKCRMRELDNKGHGAMFRFRFRPALLAEIEKMAAEFVCTETC